MPRMSPDGSILYVADKRDSTPPQWNRIMRVCSSGDTPQLVMEGNASTAYLLQQVNKLDGE